MKIDIINGPNLNLVGTRETHIYGTQDLEHDLKELQKEFTDLEIRVLQSNHEGEIIDHLQKIKSDSSGIIINPAAYTHTSIGIRDALAIQTCPIIEVHLSKISEREVFRKDSLTRDYAWSFIEGYGTEGYKIAINRIKEIIKTS